MSRLLAMLLLFYSAALGGTTRYASTCSQADVNTQLLLSSSGDTVVMPSGSATWTAALFDLDAGDYSGYAGVKIPSGVALVGAGKGSTIITNNTGAANAHCVAMILAPSTTGVLLDGFTIISAQSHLASAYSDVAFYGQDVVIRNVAITNIEIRGITALQGTSGGITTGVIHNCDFSAKAGSSSAFQMFAISGRDNDPAPAQNTSAGTYGTETTFGGAMALYIENCTFDADHTGDSTVEMYYGAKVVVRYCTGRNFSVGIHGNDSSERSSQSIELYNNTITVDVGTSFYGIVISRGGTGLVHHNTITLNTGASNRIALSSYRSSNPDLATPFPSYREGQLDGSNPHDGNTAYHVSKGTGAHTGSNGASTLTDSGQSWTANELRFGNAYPIVDFLQTGFIWNRTTGAGGRIQSNTGTTVTATLSGGTRQTWNAGDVYVITRGYPGLDQNGWAGPTVFHGTYSTQTLTPWYAWANTVNGDSSGVPFYVGFTDSSYTSLTQPDVNYFIQENREYYNNTAKPGYVTYTYPHPLNTTGGTSGLTVGTLSVGTLQLN